MRARKSQLHRVNLATHTTSRRAPELYSAFNYVGGVARGAGAVSFMKEDPLEYCWLELSGELTGASPAVYTAQRTAAWVRAQDTEAALEELTR